MECEERQCQLTWNEGVMKSPTKTRQMSASTPGVGECRGATANNNGSQEESQSREQEHCRSEIFSSFHSAGEFVID